MTQLTNNLRTHIVFIRWMDWKSIEEYQITKTQYDIISEDIWSLKANNFYTITDIDSWKVLFEWQRKDIIRFKEKNLSNTSWYTAICSLWERHPIINWQIECDCINKMWIFEWDILPALRMMWYKVNYSSDITKEMRVELYKQLRTEWFKEKLSDYIDKVKTDWIKYKKSIEPEYAVNINF